MIDSAVFQSTVIATYIALLLLIGMYGLHRCWLLHLYRRHRGCRDELAASGIARDETEESLPPVTVQLPMFNEAAVVRRVIDAACALDYPRDRLQIQVLDDSTDACADLARGRVAYWADRGVDIQYRHRVDRTGYKAGALQDALPDTTGELIAIFDADFLPPCRFLRDTVPHFADDGIGMVQACWSHLNRGESLLTRAQAIFLDGHFLIEHTARNRSGAWINFNGTAGVWRRAAIESAGGWQHDTLTEDVDLSYRAQLAGWRFRFLPQVRCPAELPPHINAFRSQQHRWTKGSVQVAMKLLPTLLRSPLPRHVKMEAFFHLTCPMVYLYVTLLAALLYPAMVAIGGWGGHDWLGLVIGPVWLTLGTGSALLFYIASQTAQHRSAWRTAMHAPALMAIGVGIALSNAVGCVEALLRHDSPFVRTPKYNRTGSTGGGGAAPSHAAEQSVAERGCVGEDTRHPASSHATSLRIDEDSGAGRALHPQDVFTDTDGREIGRNSSGLVRTGMAVTFRTMRRYLFIAEIAMGCYMLGCVYRSITTGTVWTALPFLLLFAVGYLYVGIGSFRLHLRDLVVAWQARANRRSKVQASPQTVG